jgi:hypothetical protein
VRPQPGGLNQAGDHAAVAGVMTDTSTRRAAPEPFIPPPYPRGQLAALLDFVELDWSSQFEAGFARQQFASGRGQAFRRDLDPANLALLDGSLRRHLETWGYPVDAV